MRNLQFKDVFTVSRILNKMKISFEMEAGMTAQQIGTMFIKSFIEHIGQAEKEVMAFMADLKGIKESELASYNLEESFDLIMEFKDIPELKDFIERVGKLMAK